MKVKLVVLIAIATILTATVIPASTAASPLPCLFVSPPGRDLGEIRAGQAVSSTFTLTNTGQSALSILSVSTSCSCLTAAVSAVNIPPGGGAELVVRFDPRERIGSFTGFVILRTDDPARPLYRLRITGRIARDPDGRTTDAEPAAGMDDAPAPPKPAAIEHAAPIASESPPAGAESRPTASAERRGSAAGAIPPRAANILFFHSPTCADCRRLKDRLLPALQAKRPETAVVCHDVLTGQGYLALLDIERQLGRGIDKTPPVAVIGRTVLAGARAIEERLEEEILRSGEPTPEPVSLEKDAARDELARLGPFMVIAGGLIDGINPCAFATLIFLLSFLAVAGRRGGRLLLVGAAFAAGVFLAYFLVGLGLAGLVAGIQKLGWVQRAFNISVATVLAVLGAASLRDYFLIRRGRTRETALQLSGGLKRTIHAVIRALGGRSSAGAAGFVMGFLVALLEFPCTGQVYLPVVAAIQGAGPLRAKALTYLLLYNALFILPLLAVFALAHLGVSSARLAAFARRHLGLAKLLSVALFWGLAAAIAIL